MNKNFTRAFCLLWLSATGLVAHGQASKQVQSVGTISDLKARRPVVREVIEVRNGSATNLWAAPRTFVHDPDATDAADDVYVVTNAAASGRYTATDRSTGIIDPRIFGAIPDDLYDDSTPMIAAFAAAGTRASVYIPQGRFIITQPLPLVDRLHVHGEGDGSMIAVANTNGIAFWNATPGTRVYEVFLENFAINTALGVRGHIAVSLTNVSYARLEKLTIHAYDGKGFQYGVKPWGDSPASVGGAWSSSMVGCRIYVYPRPGQPAYAFYGSGGPEWGHGPNSWRIIDNYLNCQPESVFLDGGTNHGTAVLFAQNQNGIQISKNIFEGSYTNSIILDTGAASTIDGNRFEVAYGIGGTNFAAVRMNNMTNVFIAGNMSQGLGDVTKYVRGVNSSYTLFDAASGSPNTIDGDLILGKTWNVDNTGYLPTVDRFLLLDSTEPLTRLGMGLRTIDSTTNNPRAVMTLNANPTNGMSWAGIWHAATPGSIPFYFYQQNQTNLAITATGSGVLGLPTTSAALSVYGAGAFGSSPGVTGGWTDMNEGVWVRTTDYADKAGFHAIVNDGTTNRRVELTVNDDHAELKTTWTTGGGRFDVITGNANPLSIDSDGLTVKSNLVAEGSIALGGTQRSNWPNASVNVKDHGAIGDGVTDDTAAMLAAFTSIQARGTIYVPKGIYSITSTLYVTNNAVTIRGDGPDSSTIWMRSNGPAMYVGFPGFDGGISDYSRHQFVLEDFGVRGVDGVTNQVGIQVSAASRVALNRVFAETFGDEHEKGFFFDRWSWWISVQNCKTYNCWIGLLASGNTTNVNIPENSFNAADFSGNTFRSGRYGMILGDPLYSTNTPLLPTAYAVGIRNSSFENFGELGVWIASPWNCIVDNNYIENNPIGVRIGATNWTSRVYDQAKNVSVKNNHIYTLTNSASAGLVLQDEKTCVQIQGGLFATIKENHFMGYKRAAVEIQSTGVKQTAIDGNGYYNYAEIPRVIGPFAGVAGNSFYHRWIGESWIGSGTNGPDELINNIVIDGSTNLFRAQVVLTNKPLQFAHGASDWKLSKFLDENRGLFHGGFSVSNGGINLLSTNGAGYALAYKRDYDPAQRTVIPQDGTLRFSDGTFDPDVGMGYAGATGWLRMWTNIQGYGHVSVGPYPSIWSGYAKYGDRGIYHTSTDTSARPEVLIGYQDGTTNQRVGIAVSNRIGIVSALASLGGSEIRFMVDDQHAATVTNAGVVIPSGKSINMGGDTIDDFTGTGLSVVGGKLTATGGGTNASTVFVDGTQVDAPNFVISTEIDPSVATSTNVSLALRDGSIGTNRVDANFHALLVAGGGSGDVTLAGTNLFTGQNTFGGATTISNLSVPGTMTVGSVSFGTPLGLSNGGTGGTNAETARTSLGLAIGSDVQGWDEHLQQLATVGWASGDVPWFDGSNLTNLVTTAAGRALMTAANAAAQWAALQSSALQAGAYDAGTWDGVTDKAITPDQFRDVIAALPGGSNAVATVTPPLYLSNGVLTLDTDGLGGGAGGSGFVYILTNGVGAWQPQSASTNWPVISTTISSNDLPDATGKFIEGGYSCIMSNNSGTTATVFFDVLVGGVSVFRDSYTYNSTAGYRPLASQFYLVRESSNTASLVQSGGHVASASTTTAGIGDFGASMIGALIVTTNIAVNWSTNLAFGVSLSSSTSVSTNDALGITVANAWMRRDATAGGGTGDVVGPASSTTNNIAVFADATGKLLADGGVTVTSLATEAEVAAGYEPLNANKYQVTNATLTAASTSGSTGSGAFVRADSPTLSGNWAFDDFTANTISVLSNLYAVTVAYGAGWNGSSNVPTRDSVYDEMELRAPKASPAITGTLTVNGTNTMAEVDLRVLRAGDTMGGTLTLSGTASPGTSNSVAASTKYVDDAAATKQATIGASTTLTTGPLLVTSDFVQNSASIASALGAAVVLDFKWPVATFAATNNVIVLQSTNRPAATTNVVFSMLRITGDTVDRTISYPASWKRLGTNITTIPSNKVVLVSGMCIGTAESGVTFGVAKEE